MTITTVTIPNGAPYGQKSHVARVRGRDPKFRFQREFCAQTVTELGVYVGSTDEKKGRKGERFHAVVRNDAGDLIVVKGLSEETLALLVDGYLDRMDDVRPYLSDDKWHIKRDGKIVERTSRDVLEAERARLVARLAEIDAQLAGGEASK